MRVLIIDDDMRNIFALSAVLKSKGMNSLSASSFAEGLKLLAENGDIAIILLDIMMPEIDGYEGIKKIRANEKTNKIPVIAVTAKAMDGDRKKCLEAGADDYVSKPVDINNLMLVLSKYINSQKLQSAESK